MSHMLVELPDLALRGQDPVSVMVSWQVFPVVSDGKRPAVRGWQQWARGAAGYANFGIACGPSGLLVLDIDMPDGYVTLEALEAQHGRLPATYTVATPSGGRHLYYTTGEPLRCTVGRLGRGIDTRGQGGYVVGAGSSIGGRAYRVLDDRGPVPLPAWVQELVR